MSESLPTLYYAPGAASLVVHWLLIELDVPHRLKRVDLEAGEQHGPAYRAINPAGTVPALQIGDGYMTETVALLLWLGEQRPAAGLLPARDSAGYRDYLQAMARLANTLMPAFRRWFYPTEVAGAGNEAAVKEAAREVIETEFTRWDARLAAGGPYLLGATPCVADFYLTMLMRWSRNMPKPATSWPAIAGYVARMKARPSFKVLYEREGLTEWA